MKKIVIYVVSVTLFLLSGCEKGFDYRNKWEGNYTFYRDYDAMTGYLIVKKSEDENMDFRFIWYEDNDWHSPCYTARIDKKGNISSCGGHGIDGGHFIKRDSIIVTHTNYGHVGSSRITYYCKKTKKDIHDVVSEQ